MDFNEYQRATANTAVYPDIGTLGELYPALGLANEAGEVLGAIKKVYRDGGGAYTAETLGKIASELSDVLWYVAQVAERLNLDLNEIAKANIEKLESRKLRGVLQGSGGDR